MQTNSCFSFQRPYYLHFSPHATLCRPQINGLITINSGASLHYRHGQGAKKFSTCLGNFMHPSKKFDKFCIKYSLHRPVNDFGPWCQTDCASYHWHLASSPFCQGFPGSSCPSTWLSSHGPEHLKLSCFTWWLDGPRRGPVVSQPRPVSPTLQCGGV